LDRRQTHLDVLSMALGDETSGGWGDGTSMSCRAKHIPPSTWPRGTAGRLFYSPLPAQSIVCLGLHTFSRRALTRSADDGGTGGPTLLLKCGFQPYAHNARFMQATQGPKHPSSERQSYAFQQFEIIVVPGLIKF